MGGCDKVCWVPGASGVSVKVDGDVVVLVVEGRLDGTSGAALLRALDDALAEAPNRIDVDLRPVTGFTTAGCEALVACRSRGTDLRDDLLYCTGPGPGRDALLRAYDGEEPGRT